VNLDVTQNVGDFTLSPQAPQITVQAGASGTVGVNLTSISNFDGVVTLTCTPSSSNITCGVNPSSPTLNGIATATLTVNASSKNAAASASAQAQAGAQGAGAHRGGRLIWLAAESSLMMGMVWIGGFGRRKRRGAIVLSVVVFVLLVAFVGCGSGGGSGTSPPPPPPPPASVSTYSVVVSGTANGIEHDAKVIVMVPAS
jgi:hypothetical protein